MWECDAPPVAGVPPGPLTRQPYGRPEPYHRILRTRDYRFWRPILGLVIAGVSALLVVPLVLSPVLVVPALVQGGDSSRYVDDLADGRITPVVLAYSNLVLAGLLLAACVSIRLAHRTRPRWLSSVRPGLRWRWLGTCALAAALICIAQLGLALVGQPGEASSGRGVPGDRVALVLVIALTTPLQATGEEYFFRGYLTQAFGALVSRPWFTIGVTSILFALAHGTQNPPLFVDRLAFGLTAAVLVWRTGGLEAGIAWHVSNNLVALLYAVATGTLSQTLTISAAGWDAVVADLVQMVVFAVIVTRLARRRRIQRLTTAPPLGAHA